jgi:hypothetical protein
VQIDIVWLVNTLYKALGNIAAIISFGKKVANSKVLSLAVNLMI